MLFKRNWCTLVCIQKSVVNCIFQDSEVCDQRSVQNIDTLIGWSIRGFNYVEHLVPITAIVNNYDLVIIYNYIFLKNSEFFIKTTGKTQWTSTLMAGRAAPSSLYCLRSQTAVFQERKASLRSKRMM